MTSEEMTLIPSLIQLIRSDLFTFENISSSVTLEAPNTGIILNNADDGEEEKEEAERFFKMTSQWNAVISYLPLEFFRLIESIPGIVSIEDFDPKYIRNPKMCAYDKYGTTNMWRPLMILNKCPTIMDFNFKFIRYYDIDKFSNVITLLMSRVGNS